MFLILPSLIYTRDTNEFFNPEYYRYMLVQGKGLYAVVLLIILLLFRIAAGVLPITLLILKASPNEGYVVRLEPAASVERVCNRISLVARQLSVRHRARAAHLVRDEYDLQDLLHALLRLFFDDVRAEEYTPSYAGRSSRMDFLLKEESIVIEVKMMRDGLGKKEVGEELTIDIAWYKKHSDCKTLFCLVYDPTHRLTNPRGLENDLSGKTDSVNVKVFVVPKES